LRSLLTKADPHLATVNIKITRRNPHDHDIVWPKASENSKLVASEKDLVLCGLHSSSDPAQVEIFELGQAAQTRVRMKKMSFFLARNYLLGTLPDLLSFFSCCYCPKVFFL